MAEVSRKIYAGYGLVSFPLALVAITFYVYIPKFYTDVYGLDLKTVGAIVLISRIWDALIDPIIGARSDATVHPMGRRRPWIFYSLLPLCLSFSCLLMPWLSPSLISLELWFLIWTFLFFLFWTTLAVPYESLGPELTYAYHERTKLLGFRDGALVLGTLCAAIFPYLLTSSGISDQQTQFQVLALAYSLLLVFFSSLCLRWVKERKSSIATRTQMGTWQNVKDVLSNRAFRILLVSYTVSGFGAALPATLILYYVEYVLRGSLEQANMFLVLYFLVGFLCLPVWIWLSKRFGKKETWLFAMLVNTVAFLGVFFLGAGDMQLYGILVTVSALGYGATLALPSSMQADVIDSDEFAYGVRREGQFIGLWSISKKLSAALGAGVALHVLGLTGYVPGQEQGEDTIFALRLLYAGVPCLCNLAAIFLALPYPITEKEQQEFRRSIDGKHESER